MFDWNESLMSLQSIYGRNGLLVSSSSCCVLHHTTNPAWYDEIKFRLPAKLTPQHHLLFTFTHISIEGSKKRETGPENPVGYAWIPLIQKGRSVDSQPFLHWLYENKHIYYCLDYLNDTKEFKTYTTYFRFYLWFMELC